MRTPALVGAVILAVPMAAWASPQDRTPPTMPRNLRVVALTPYTATLAWEPSTDKSGVVLYKICCANVSSQTVAAPANTAVYTAGLEARRSFTLHIYAVDAAGNFSKPSNAVSFTTPADTTPPTQPVVSVTDVGPTHVSLLWSSVEDGPFVWFDVFKDGTPILQGMRSTSMIVPLLAPVTTHSFTVRARDFGGNRSPLSAPVVAETEAPDPNDVTAPTTPANFAGDGCDEVALSWTASSDDLDPAWIIRYDIYVNDVLDHSLSLGVTRTIVYGTGASDTFSVVAVDTAGNASAPATITEADTCR
jgi:hypothetical protein